jgi:transposase-like protein
MERNPVTASLNLPMALALLQQANPACPACRAAYTIKKGRRRNRFRIIPLFQCNECGHRFTNDAGKHKTYPLKTILDAVSTFNLGYSLTETQRNLRKRAQTDIPERTIRSWVSEYRPLTTYARLRGTGKSLFAPNAIVHSRTFDHQQVYRFGVHQAKLKMLLALPAHRHLAPLTTYLRAVDTTFPHHLFQATEHRSSKFPATLNPPITRKENHATRLAALVLPTSPNNKKRHETLQHFMLVNDSVTVAVEIPVYLTREDLAYFRSRRFSLGFDSEVITGHIDFLQIRNGHIHILDYKPEARKETHAHVQLTIYALALSRRTGMPLKYRVSGKPAPARKTFRSSVSHFLREIKPADLLVPSLLARDKMDAPV